MKVSWERERGGGRLVMQGIFVWVSFRSNLLISSM